MNSLNQFKKDHYSINIDGKEIEREAYLVSLANSGQYGNNTWIAPLAQIDDGLLDVVVVKSINWWNVWRLAYLIKSKNLDKAKSVEIYKGKKIIINKFGKRYAHIDGEPIMADEQIDVSIIPKALCVLKL
jgi:diacylglycerol kinase family enzyme